MRKYTEKLRQKDKANRVEKVVRSKQGGVEQGAHQLTCRSVEGLEGDGVVVLVSCQVLDNLSLLSSHVFSVVKRARVLFECRHAHGRPPEPSTEEWSSHGQQGRS